MPLRMRNNLKITNRVTIGLAAALLAVGTLELAAQAQVDPAITIDRMLRFDSTPAGIDRQSQIVVMSFKKWMGAYQRLRKDGNTYMAVFDRGSLPIEARFKSSGAFDGLNFGCPVTNSLSLNDAPIELRQALTKCTGFKPRSSIDS
jgi:hypothetical protein